MEEITFKSLKFKDCPNGNKCANITINGLQLDVVKIMEKRVYKVKPFEIISGKKMYNSNYFDGYGDYPIFAHRDQLIVFLNEVKNSEDERDIEDS